MKGEWYTTGQEADLWVDTSSFATGMLLEDNGAVFEDACWLLPDNINLSELDAVV